MTARFRTTTEERDQGFTLIELLVVIIIIGILAAIAIPTFLNQRNKGYDAQAQSDVRNAQIEIETSFTDNQKYPADLTGITLKQSATAGAPSYLVNAGLTNYCLSVKSRSGSYYKATNTQSGVLRSAAACAAADAP